MYIPSEVKTRRPLKYWQELLEQWLFLVERVTRVTNNKHCVYSYKERTNLGLLSSAAATNGWIALEECRSEKYQSHETSDTYQGRADLLIWRDNRHHEVEAKFVRIPLNNSDSVRFDRAYENAISDSLRSTPSDEKSDKKIAITFVVPTLTNTQIDKFTDDDISQNIQGLVDYIDSEYKPCLLAYSFPGNAPCIGAKSRQSLGVILVGKVT